MIIARSDELGIQGNICVKQSPSFCLQRFRQAGPGLHQESGDRQTARQERMQIEVNAYREMEVVLGNDARKYLPRIYEFKPAEQTITMDSLNGWKPLQECLCEGVADLRMAKSLGEFLAAVHGGTHVSRIEPMEAKRLQEVFANPDLRAVQLEHVYTKPFLEHGSAEKIRKDAVLAGELNRLRAAYSGQDAENLALCHGDFRPECVFIAETSGAIRIVDLEFAVYGPPGVDLGSILAGFAMAHIRHATSGRNRTDFFTNCMSQVLGAYMQTMTALEVSENVLHRIGEDSIVFACCSVAQDAVGLLECRNPLTAQVLDRAMGLVRTCLQSARGRDCHLLIEELNKAGDTFSKCGNVGCGPSSKSIASNNSCSLM